MCELSLGRAIKTLRKKNNLSQWDLAMKTGLKPGHISKLENEKIGQPTIQTIFRLAQAFRIKPSEFICIAENENKDSCDCNPKEKESKKRIAKLKK